MRSFKRILLTVIAFVLVAGVLSIGLMEAYFRTEYDFFQDGTERDSLAGSLDCLYCGASHGYRAFNPAVTDPILGTQSYNISGSMMTMQGRWELLREEIDRNPVKTVYLEVSYNTMTRNRVKEGTEGDLYLLARLTGFFHRASFFFRAFSLQEQPSVYQKFVSEGFDATWMLFRGEKVNHSQRSRGYMPTGPRALILNTDYESLFHTVHYSTELYPDNVEYMDRILSLCKERGIEVVLVTTPLSKTALCKADNYQYFYEWYQTLAEKWGLQYYDFNLYRQRENLLDDETMYYDTMHLNDEGATVFSAEFADLMLRARSGEDLSALFYESYAQMEEAVFDK